MQKNRFFKSTLGVDAESIVAKAVAYTDDTTMKDFQANAVEGEIAVVKFSDNTIYSGAVAVGDRVYLAIKRDGNVRKTAPFVGVAGMVQKLAYVAPVKHVVTVTTTTGVAQLIDTGTDITYTSRLSGLDGNDITIAYVDPAGNNQALAVTVSATAISVSLATNGGGTITSTKTLIAAAVNAHATASVLVDATVTGTGSDVATAMSATNLAGGSADGLVMAKGKYFELLVIETTPGLEPLPRQSYQVTANQSESFNDAMVRLVAKINDATSVENKNKTLIVTAAIAANDNITLTAIDNGVHFRAAIRGDWENFASVAVTTPFKIGRGTYDQVKQAETESDIRAGQNTQYPMQNATDAEFGVRTSFADVAAAAVTTPQFVTYQFTFTNEMKSVRNDKEFRKNYVFLFVHDSTTDPISALDTVIGSID